MKKNVINIILVLLLAIGAGLIALPQTANLSLFGWDVGQYFKGFKVKLGLDLQGGAHLVYRADMSRIPKDNIDDSLIGVRDTIERRINAYGVAEPQIYTNKSGDEYRVVVDLAGVQDVRKAIDMIGETPILDFREQKSEEELKQELALSPEEKQKAIEANKKAEEKAKEVLQKAVAGEDFATLAKNNSEDPMTASKGGDLGSFKKGEMVPEFDAVIFNPDFQVGTVWPELVRTDYGYHIIKKTGETGEGDDKEVSASHILFVTENEEMRNDPNAEMFKMTNLTGKDLDRAQVVFDQNTNQPQVSLEFNENGKNLFREITERNVGKRVAIYLDGEPITVPVVQTVIADGRAVITGSKNVTEAQDLARRLNSGALPVPIELVSQETVGPSLGEVYLQKSIQAGVIGLSLIVIFLVLYYLLPGVVATIVLLLYAVLLLALFKIFGITLTLSGVAGFILSLGMAIDANILVFERIKEELRWGESFERAMENGFKRAWTSVRDGNMSTLITCVVIMSIGTGMVKGFAITLFVGVVVSIFTAVFITRSIMRFLFPILKGKLFLGYPKSEVKAEKEGENNK